MDWDNRKDRGTKGYYEGRDGQVQWASKRRRDGETNFVPKEGLVELSPLRLPLLYKFSWKVVEIFKGYIN